jgi:hypothetical protein
VGARTQFFSPFQIFGKTNGTSYASLAIQAARLLLLAIPVACVRWTVRHEEVFYEPREYCQRQTRIARSAPSPKVLLSVPVRILFQPLMSSWSF